MFEVAVVITDEFGDHVSQMVFSVSDEPSRDEDAKIWRYMMGAVDEARGK